MGQDEEGGTLNARSVMESARRFKAHPQSAPGDFYVVNDECISCGAPHAVAPDLIGWATNVEYDHCIWKKQPGTPEELEQAFAAFDASEVGCYRYAGGDPKIIARIGSDFCDHVGIRPDRTERREAEEFPFEFHFSLTASKQSTLGSNLKQAIARLAAIFRRQ